MHPGEPCCGNTFLLYHNSTVSFEASIGSTLYNLTATECATTCYNDPGCTAFLHIAAWASPGRESQCQLKSCAKSAVMGRRAIGRTVGIFLSESDGVTPYTCAAPPPATPTIPPPPPSPPGPPPSEYLPADLAACHCACRQDSK